MVKYYFDLFFLYLVIIFTERKKCIINKGRMKGEKEEINRQRMIKMLILYEFYSLLYWWKDFSISSVFPSFPHPSMFPPIFPVPFLPSFIFSPSPYTLLPLIYLFDHSSFHLLHPSPTLAAGKSHHRFSIWISRFFPLAEGCYIKTEHASVY